MALGDFDTRAFNRLVDGKHPATNAQLTPRHRSDRICLWDFTFDCPKSVTLAIWYNPEEERIREAFHQAVRDTMREDVEPLAATRIRGTVVSFDDGKMQIRPHYDDRQTGNMTWAMIPHSLARPVKGRPDPQEHVHATIFNHTWDATENRFKALKVHEIKKQAPVLQDAFHQRLRSNIEALGFKTVDKGSVFELAGVSDKTIKKFSQRRNVITEFIDKHLVKGKRLGKVGIETREEKGEEHTLADLKAEWDSRLTRNERVGLEWLKAKPKLGNLGALVRKNKAHVALLQRIGTLAGFGNERETRTSVWGRS
ncbi:Multifunctional conjugation protein TraI [Gemmata sp. SH-PL17]|nr:Multifunctional conjugation protein TraI [Gemmata sp. SH-PL17]